MRIALTLFAAILLLAAACYGAGWKWNTPPHKTAGWSWDGAPRA